MSEQGGDPIDKDSPSGAARDARNRQLAQEALARRLGQQPEWERIAVGELEARLRARGVDANPMGIPVETADELVTEWERLIGLYPVAARLWKSIGPDVGFGRFGARKWLGYHAGQMLWHPGHMTRPTSQLREIAAASVATGAHPDGCGTLAAVACHEFGHLVEDAVGLSLGREGSEALRAALVGCSMGAYAEGRPDECFAVAFPAMHHGRSLGAGAQMAVSTLVAALRAAGM